MTLQYGGMFEQGDMRYLLSSGNVEDNFNTWTAKWIAAIPNGLKYDFDYDFWIDDKNDLIYLAWNDSDSKYRWGIFNTADFSTVFLSAAGEYYTASEPYLQATHMTFGNAYWDSGGISHSFQTYLLLQRSDTYTLEIWSSGIKLFTWDYRDDFHTTNCLSFSGGISLTGKYIMLELDDYDPSPTVEYLMLYQGSYVEP